MECQVGASEVTCWNLVVKSAVSRLLHLGLDRCSAPDCQERYEEYHCSRFCGLQVVILKEIEHSDICSLCFLRAQIEGLVEGQRAAIRQLAKSGQRRSRLSKWQVEYLGYLSVTRRSSLTNWRNSRRSTM